MADVAAGSSSSPRVGDCGAILDVDAMDVSTQGGVDLEVDLAASSPHLFFSFLSLFSFCFLSLSCLKKVLSLSPQAATLTGM